MLAGAGQRAEGVHLAAQELTWSTSLHLRPVCGNGGRPMYLVGAPPATSDIWYSQTYSCGECGVRKTETAIDRQSD